MRDAHALGLARLLTRASRASPACATVLRSCALSPRLTVEAFVLLMLAAILGSGCREASDDATDAGDAAADEASCLVSLDERPELPRIYGDSSFEIDGHYFIGTERPSGNGGALLHFDGEIWSSIELEVDDGSVVSTPDALWAARPDLVFIVAGSRVYRAQGDELSVELAPKDFRFTAIWGFSDNDVWVSGYEYPDECFDCSIPLPLLVEFHHFDGARWTRVSTGFEGRVSQLWGSAPDDLWAFGSGALHYDGKMWSRVPGLDDALGLERVSVRSSDDIWLATNEGHVVRYNGDQWQVLDMGSRYVTDVQVLSDGSIYAYAQPRQAGIVTTSWLLRWTGSEFEIADAFLPVTHATAQLGSYQGQLLLQDHASYRLEGNTFKPWYEPNVHAALTFAAAFEASPPGALAVRNEALVVLEGAGWRELTAVPNWRAARDLAARSAQDAWLVSAPAKPDQPLAQHWNGTRFEAVQLPDASKLVLRSAAIGPDGSVWLGGANLEPETEDPKGPARVLFSMDGKRWEDVAPDLGDVTGVVVAIADDQVWIAAGSKVARYDAGAWARYDLPDSDSQAELVAAGRDDLYALLTPRGEAQAKLFHFDGVKWRAVQALEGKPLRGLDARAGRVVVTGWDGDRPLAWTSDGGDWHPLALDPLADLPVPVVLSDSVTLLNTDRGTWLERCLGTLGTLTQVEGDAAAVGGMRR